MLGPQFDTTYWHEGDDQEMLMRKGVKNGGPTGYTRSEPMALSGDFDPLQDLPEKRRAKGIQGSLFSPYVGTGLKEDPTVSARKRYSTAAGALGHIQDVGWNPSTGADSVHTEAVRQALVNSDMPIHVMRQSTVAGTVVHAGNLGPNAGGSYNPISRVISLREPDATHTLVHEMGHNAEPHGVTAWNHRVTLGKGYDPLEEGSADAWDDRYATRMHHPDTAARSRETLAARRSQLGYTEKSWEAPLHQAMYNSARTIASSSDRGIKDIPNREALFDDRVETYKQYKEGGGIFQGHPDIPLDTGREDSDARLMHSMDKLAMGHMMEHHGPTIRPSLNESQLSAAMDAHDYYKKTEPRSFLSHPGEEYHQEKLL